MRQLENVVCLDVKMDRRQTEDSDGQDQDVELVSPYCTVLVSIHVMFVITCSGHIDGVQYQSMGRAITLSLHMSRDASQPTTSY